MFSQAPALTIYTAYEPRFLAQKGIRFQANHPSTDSTTDTVCSSL